VGFKFGSDKTVTIPVVIDGDEESVTLRKEVSRKVRNSLIPFFPDHKMAEGESVTIQEGVRMQDGLFEALVAGWSAKDEKGKAIPATLANYQAMTSGIDELDAVIAEHFQTMFPSEEVEGKPSTSQG
jgi:hypothetical protein